MSNLQAAKEALKNKQKINPKGIAIKKVAAKRRRLSAKDRKEIGEEVEAHSKIMEEQEARLVSGIENLKNPLDKIQFYKDEMKRARMFLGIALGNEATNIWKIEGPINGEKHRQLDRGLAASCRSAIEQFKEGIKRARKALKSSK